MYNTRLEVLEAIAAKYENATALSKDDRGACFYSPNGIEGTPGCAIGCLFTPEQARLLDSLEGAIDKLYKRIKSRPVLATVFNLETITVGDLVDIQGMHDDAPNVDSFRRTLQAEIKAEKAKKGI